MKTKITLVSLIVLSAIAGYVYHTGKPVKLPPDGIGIFHTWYITAITPSNTVLVLNGRKQEWWKETDSPHSHLGPDIRCEWFKPPIHTVTDKDGNKWFAVMIK